MNRIVSKAAVALAFILAQLPTADAAQIHVWTARAIGSVLAEIGPQFERTTGNHLEIYQGLPADFQRRYDAGEVFDVLVSASGPIAKWIKEGRLVAKTRTNVARAGIGVEVRAGAPKPGIGSVEAFKRTLLDAKSIAYLKVGSGVLVAKTLERLGIAGAVKPKVVQPETDIVSELVAKGEVEVGLVVIAQILTTPGVQFVGPLPPQIQSYVMFTGAVGTKSKAPHAANQLLKFLAGPTAAAVLRAHGMEQPPL
jgi:molybdate transport system substrate-binding protein